MALIYALLIFLVLLIVLVYYFSAKIIYPKLFTLEETYHHEVEDGKINDEEFRSWPQQAIVIHSLYGYDLHGLYLPVEGSKKTVVVSHGITLNRFGAVKYAELFRQRGFNTIVYDLRNHGENVRKNTTFGYYEKHDLKAVVDWAFEQIGLDGIIGTMGESLGAATTIQHAAIDQRIAFAVADCPYSDLRELLAFRLRVEFKMPSSPILELTSLFCGVITGMTFDKVSPIRDIPQVTTPILFIHGQKDTYIPPRMSIAMFEKKTGLKRLYFAPNADHAQSYWNNREEYNQQLDEFLKEVFQARPA